MANDIIDNRNEKLVDNVNLILDSTDQARFAVGYFFLSGFTSIAKELQNLTELRLLIGNTSTRETIEQLAEGHRELSAIENATEDLTYSSRAMRRTRADETAENLRRCLESMPQTDESEQLIKTLSEMIISKKLKVRIYTKGRLHAKAYIFNYKQNGRYETGISIVGSSNLTLAGLSSNTELNVVVHGDANQEQLRNWFDELWEESEDFDKSLMEEMQTSWALAPIRPYDIYMKTLYELVKERLERDEDRLSPTANLMEQLADFQQVAVWQAIKIINKYGGAFVSDVVGLGKSYIGSAIVKYFEQVEDARPLIFCPPALIPMWERYSEVHHLNAQVVSSGILSNDEENARDLLFEHYKDRRFILIDESHNFRNQSTQRYRILQDFLTTGEKKCCFLTATPRNKSAWDIYHQFKLFHPDDNTDLPIEPAHLREYFRHIERGTRDLRAFLQHILIRRTRNHILRWYGYDAETHEPVNPTEFGDYLNHQRRAYVRIGDKHQFFPQRILKTVEYSIEETYKGLYQQIRESLGTSKTHTATQLTYARYGLWHYVKKGKQGVSPYRDLQSAGKNLRGLIRVLLFKRFESSVYAFKQTISRLLNVHTIFLNALDNGIVAAGEEAQQILYDASNADETDIDSDERDILDELRKLSDSYDIKDFNVKTLRKDIQHDIEVLTQILEPVQRITTAEDAKLQTLKNLLKTAPLHDGKRLIFTRYVDTAQYLYENLKTDDTEVIYSSNRDKQKIVARFAPNANPEHRQNSDDNALNTLIATDVLAEGLNLQDCGMLINYDLHWNPVRLIQRFGRIDRIGSEFDKIHGFNFLPELGIERNLGLQETLRNRIQEIHDTIGEDAAILDNTEQLNEEAMYAIYEQDNAQLNLFEDSQEASMSFIEAEEILRQIKRQDPEEYERIANLRDGIRTGIPATTKGTYIFCRLGSYQQPCLFDENGQLVTTDPAEILQRLQCDPESQGQPVPSEHNARVAKQQKDFAAQNRNRTLFSVRQLTPAQRYILKELRLLSSTSKDTKAISRLDRIFRLPLTEVIKRDINRLHRRKITGDELLTELTILYHRYNMADLEKLRPHSDEQSESYAKIICSAAFV